MKILITGASGFLGSALCKAMAGEGHDVLGLDVAIPVINVAYRQLQCDLLTIDLTEILKTEAPKRIVHCAGNANVGHSVRDPFMDLNGSYVLLHRLLYAAKAAELSTSVLFLSSAAVYGNPVRIPIAEEDARHPVSPYGLHKAACEDLCAYFSRVERVDCRVMRIFSAYGAGLRKQILWDLCAKLHTPGRIEMFGTGSETRDFIHVDDIVEAARLIMDHGQNGVYNVANGEEIRIEDIARQLLRVAGEPQDRLFFNGRTKEGDPLNWKAETGKLKALGFEPNIPLERGIEDYYRWRRQLG
jgi:UDP-glucose 4-epimerase